MEDFIMATSEPIRNTNDIQRIKQYLLMRKRWRDYALITMGLNTALRISDLLSLKWGDVFNFHKSAFHQHIYLYERKTHKCNIVLLNTCIIEALKLLKANLSDVKESDYLFQSRLKSSHPIHRSRAYSIIREIADNLQLEGTISCHSLRKSFGYHAWKTGHSPAVIMEIYNHSSLNVTRRYLSINQDDKDQVYLNILL